MQQGTVHADVLHQGTSYDRWFEGAKDWQNTLSDVRSLARFMWYNIDLAVLSPPDSLSEEEREQWREERQERKKEAVRLLSLFLYATKVRPCCP
jgi:predicted membrane chloride channel (bestrophin family)